MLPPECGIRVSGTVFTREYPFTPTESSEYEYPFPDARNADLYSRYRTRANSVPDLLLCGRLGEYRYYDMDQAIALARLLASKLLSADTKAQCAKAVPQEIS